MFIIICIILNNHNHRSKMLMSFVPRAFLLTDPLKHSTYPACPHVFGMHIFYHTISRLASVLKKLLLTMPPWNLFQDFVAITDSLPTSFKAILQTKPVFL